MESVGPLEPKPRPVPVPRTITESELKKPVPLPRSRPKADSSLPSDAEDQAKIAPRDLLPKRSSKRLKEEFRAAQERGAKAMIEGTRIVGAQFEKTVRNMIDKHRPTTVVLPKEEEIEKSPPIESVPLADIFQSISFHSPLNDNDFIMQKCDSEDEEEVYNCNAPPPSHPPPPLPDESIYDELHSVVSSKSSHGSSNYDPYYCSSFSGSVADCESLYEDISIINPQIRSHSKPNDVDLQRSDSWSFIRDSAPSSPPDPQDAASIFNNIYNNDPTSATFSRTISCSSASISLLDGLENLQMDSGDSEEESSPSLTSSRVVENDLYQNAEPSIAAPLVPLRSKPPQSCQGPSQSVIFEFDPLFVNPQEGHDYDHMSLAQSMAPYGKINKILPRTEPLVETSESDDDLFPCPVVPPRRYDSITPTSDGPPSFPPPNTPPCLPKKLQDNRITGEAGEVKSAAMNRDVRSKAATQHQRRISEDQLEASRLRSKEDVHKRNASIARWTSMKKAIRNVADGSRRSLVKVVEFNVHPSVERPGTTILHATHGGTLYRAGLLRDFQPRYCQLAEGRLTLYVDSGRSELKDVVMLNTILSIQLVLDHKATSDGVDLHCLEINTSTKGKTHLFGATASTERKVWMQKFLECLTTVFPLRISSDYSRAGWCYMKEGISGIWTGAWILLNNRTLFYSLNNSGVQEIDLRKARCIELQDGGDNTPKVEEKGQIILVDFPGQSLYLYMEMARETVTWRNVIKASSVENGPNLSQQQLTKEDIPAVVDKCINFVYAHGSLSEGIYRRSGSNISVLRLLAQFRQDAWSVQLSRQEYSEFDVASVLKRFFRDLPESLLTTELHGQLCDIAEGNFVQDKTIRYRRALEKLPPINFLTLRKLLGHLYFIQEQAEKTLMNIENLASLWGPTLMHIEGADSLGWSKIEASVVADLIFLYPSLFNVDEAELKREKRMQEALERLHAGNSNVTPNKPSGDLKVWIHIGTRDSKNCVNVTINPQKLAGEVCIDLSSHMSLPAHELSLEEVVSGGTFIRSLHHTEQVLNVILRWGYWDEADRKNNCLVLKKNNVFSEIAPLSKLPPTHSGELKFADQKNRSFKSYLFEFSQAKLCYYKDKNGSIKLGEWRIEDIIWYIGHEQKRNPQTRWAITFRDKNSVKKRSKESPFFGCTIAGTSKEDQMRWMAAMIVGEYQQDILPTPILLH